MSSRKIEQDTSCIPISQKDDCELSHRTVQSGKASVNGVSSKHGRVVDPYRVGDYPNSAIPGYTGHVPGIRPETCYGGSRGKLLQQPQHNTGRRGTRESRRTDVIGYTGYIPGKHCCNVFGQTFVQANRTATALKANERRRLDPNITEYVTRARRLLDDIMPSNIEGNYPMYAAQERSIVKTRPC